MEDGWEAEFIGEMCVVTAVKDKSDASSKGLKPGDQILAIEGFRPTRANWWKLTYAFHTLSPRSGMKMAVVSPGEQPREFTVMSTVKNLPKNYDLAMASTSGTSFALRRTTKRETGPSLPSEVIC